MPDLNMILAENLKRERIASGITQKLLAEKIGYSEKSISKWEAGGGVPGIGTLIKLAKIFNTDLNSLTAKHINEELYLGIDGGGTKTHFALSDKFGNIKKTLILDASNPNDIGMEASKKILKEGIIKITEGVSRNKIYMFAGISGGSTGNNQATFHNFFSAFGFKAFDNSSDIKNSVELGFGKENGIIIIMGTGISSFAIKNGIYKQIGGWGQFFDAGGGSYNLGRDGIYASLREFDGTGEKTLLTTLIEKRIGTTVKKHLGVFYEKGKKYIASFSDLVLSAAEAGDRVANEIVEYNMLEVSKIINSGLEFIGSKRITVAFTGGLITKNQKLLMLIEKNLNKEYSYTTKTIAEEPVMGALKIAKEMNS